MVVPRHRDIRIGSAVSIVLKADQRTGRQVQGTVAQLLTRGDHPRGIKVRLADGRIGRVQQLVTSTPFQQLSTTRPDLSTSNMSSEQNPWQSATSSGNPYTSQSGGYSQQQQPTQQQYGQQQPQYGDGNYGNYGNTYNQHSTQSSAPAQAPSQGIQRSDTDALLAQQNDRAEQIEHMQNYESSAPQSQEDKDQAQLGKEFPNVDSSLIAALYGDTKDLSATREMLQELARA